MLKIGKINLDPPLLNSSCAWASDFKQLEDLYNCSLTGAVTTRTATLNGFEEDHDHTVCAIEHQVQLSLTPSLAGGILNST